MKRLISCAFALFLLLSACSVFAESSLQPEFTSTQAYIERLEASNIPFEYHGKQSSVAETVTATVDGSNVTMNTVAVFSNTETDCVIYVLHYIDFDDTVNFEKVCRLVNSVNSAYRYGTFYVAENNSITVKLDLLFREDVTGEITFDGLKRLANICDELYPTLVSEIEDLGGTVSAAFLTDEDELESLISDSADSALSDLASSLPASAQTSSLQAAASDEAAVLMRVKTTSGGTINVRSEADPNSILVGTVDGNKVFDCLGIAENGWYLIRLPNGLTGYISDKKANEVK